MPLDEVALAVSGGFSVFYSQPPSTGLLVNISLLRSLAFTLQLLPPWALLAPGAAASSREARWVLRQSPAALLLSDQFQKPLTETA